MNIAILGTRGIPNRYGGFEQFAETVSKGLADKGHQVTVYNPHFHDEAGNSLGNVTICYKYCPETFLGGVAHYIYDYLCLKDALSKDFDIILECGYGTASPSYRVLPVHKSPAILITNMDGIEWKRSKYPPLVKKILKWAEKVGVTHSDHLIADNTGIKRFLRQKYSIEATMIPYGADMYKEQEKEHLQNFDVQADDYFMLIARLEPANNIRTILEGYDNSGSTRPFLVIGDHQTANGEKFKNEFGHNPNIRFLGSIYEDKLINALRHYSSAYFHGHSVGGTNPSLVEAMACSSFIVANNNMFNRSVLGEGGIYFDNAGDITELLDNFENLEDYRKQTIKLAEQRVQEVYSWDAVVNAYNKLFRQVTGEEKVESTEIFAVPGFKEAV